MISYQLGFLPSVNVYQLRMTLFLLVNSNKLLHYANQRFRTLIWGEDEVNGLLSNYNYTMMYGEPFQQKLEQKFSKTSDLIESFNVLGYHDVCNVLTPSEAGYEIGN